MRTIIALSTAPTLGAIGIIRISGEKALSLTKEVFSGFDKEEIKPRYMYYGTINTGKIKDDCMCVYFKAPFSYTGEDVVEINCHGSSAITKEIIENFIFRGAHLAERGEFTKRAFENGKMDLSEAEAVIDLINAQSEEEVRSAYNQLTGALRENIQKIQKNIVTTIAKIEVSLDYPEEEIEETAKESAKKEIEEIKKELEKTENTYQSGKIQREGVKIAIIGEPNVGKSKILNALLGYERAIVTDKAGTTRDAVSESYLFNGMRFSLTDTAGIRKTTDEVEKIGVKIAKDIAKESDVILLVSEAGKSVEIPDTNSKIIRVENKIDKFEPKESESIKISALTGEGIDELKQKIYDVATKDIVLGGGSINNLRHLSAVKEAKDSILRALSATNGFTLDIVSSELMNGYRALGKITGITSADEVVGEIFSKFCVGK